VLGKKAVAECGLMSSASSTFDIEPRFAEAAAHRRPPINWHFWHERTAASNVGKHSRLRDSELDTSSMGRKEMSIERGDDLTQEIRNASAANGSVATMNSYHLKLLIIFARYPDKLHV